MDEESRRHREKLKAEWQRFLSGDSSFTPLRDGDDLSPDDLLILSGFYNIMGEDYQSFCRWLLERDCDDPLIIDVAANGIDWQSRLADRDLILEQAGIRNLTEPERLKRIEAALVARYKSGKIELLDLIDKMDTLCNRYSAYDDFGIWFALWESLGYYDHYKGNLCYELNPDNPLHSAEELLRKQHKI